MQFAKGTRVLVTDKFGNDHIGKVVHLRDGGLRWVKFPELDMALYLHVEQLRPVPRKSAA